jgi:hypothetical protein
VTAPNIDPVPFRQLHLFTAISSKLESAADALKGASLILREHILENVVDG